VNGTVLAPGESPSASRVIDEVGPWQAGAWHITWETNAAGLPMIPGGAEWLEVIDRERPEGERHLAVHAGHCSHVNSADRAGFEAMGGEVPWHGWVGEAEDVRKRAEASAAAGSTEILYTPAGDDLLGQAETFYDAVRPVQG